MTEKYLIGIGWSDDFDKSQIPDFLLQEHIKIIKLGNLAAVFFDHSDAKKHFARKQHHKLVVECCRCGTFLPSNYNALPKYDVILKRLRKNYAYFAESLKLVEGFVEIIFHVSWVKPGFNISEEILKGTWSGHNYLRQRKQVQDEIEDIKSKLNELQTLKYYGNSKNGQCIEHLIFSETAPDELTGIVSLVRDSVKLVTLKLESSFQDVCHSASKIKVAGPMPPYYLAKHIYENAISQSHIKTREKENAVAS